MYEILIKFLLACNTKLINYFALILTMFNNKVFFTSLLKWHLLLIFQRLSRIELKYLKLAFSFLVIFEHTVCREHFSLTFNTTLIHIDSFSG